MTDDLNRGARSLEPLAREMRRRQGPDHPSAETLVAYQEHRLEPGEHDEVQAHLAVCPECTQELLELARLDEAWEAHEPGTAGGTPTPGETEASWQALQARLNASPSGGAKPVSRRGRLRRWTVSPWMVPALAAALIACLIGFPLSMFIFREAVATSALILIQPSAFEISRGVGDPRQPISVAGDATSVLALPVPGRPSFTAYRIEIRRLRGEDLLLSVTPVLVPMASGPGGSPSSEGDEPGRLVSFGLPHGALARGDYRLRVVGLAGGHAEILAEHRIRVVTP
ncbi:MAG: zf-HC2 domain-containing protein [Thermoanaerobaculia bacterium]